MTPEITIYSVVFVVLVVVVVVEAVVLLLLISTSHVMRFSAVRLKLIFLSRTRSCWSVQQAELSASSHSEASTDWPPVVSTVKVRHGEG